MIAPGTVRRLAHQGTVDRGVRRSSLTWSGREQTAYHVVYLRITSIPRPHDATPATPLFCKSCSTASGERAAISCSAVPSAGRRATAAGPHERGAKVRVDGARAEIKKRVRTVKPPKPRYTSGVMAKYARLVSSASEGL
jgi:hypothetical protein